MPCASRSERSLAPSTCSDPPTRSFVSRPPRAVRPFLALVLILCPSDVCVVIAAYLHFRSVPRIGQRPPNSFARSSDLPMLSDSLRCVTTAIHYHHGVMAGQCRGDEILKELTLLQETTLLYRRICSSPTDALFLMPSFQPKISAEVRIEDQARERGSRATPNALPQARRSAQHTTEQVEEGALCLLTEDDEEERAGSSFTSRNEEGRKG